MAINSPRGVALVLSGCHGLSQDRSQSAHDLLNRLRDCDVTFLPIACSPRTDPHPEKKIGAIGAVTEMMGVEHSLLGKSFGHEHARKPRRLGSANLTYSGPGGFVQISQDVDGGDPSSWDDLADRLWSFAKLLIPQLRPDYCYLDQSGDDSWTNVWDLEINTIYWRNVFGPRYIEKYGKDIFVGAPGDAFDLDYGGILYSPETCFTKWIAAASKELNTNIVKHFSSKFPNIRLSKASSIP